MWWLASLGSTLAGVGSAIGAAASGVGAYAGSMASGLASSGLGSAASSLIAANAGGGGGQSPLGSDVGFAPSDQSSLNPMNMEIGQRLNLEDQYRALDTSPLPSGSPVLQTSMIPPRFMEPQPRSIVESGRPPTEGPALAPIEPVGQSTLPEPLPDTRIDTRRAIEASRARRPGPLDDLRSSIPESVMEGPQSRAELIPVQTGGEPQKGLARRFGETALDVLDASGGRPLYSARTRPEGSEPGWSEKILSPVADIVGVTQGRLPSREARMQRERMGLEERRIEMEEERNAIALAGNAWKLAQNMEAQGRSLPVDQQGAYFEDAANRARATIPGVLGEAIAGSLEFSSKHAGYLTPELNEILDPVDRVLLRQNPAAFAESLKKESTRTRLLANSDGIQIPKVRAAIKRAIEWKRENDPEEYARLMKEGVHSMADLRELNENLPVGGDNPVQLPGEYTGTDLSFGVIERNLDSFSDLIDTSRMIPKYLEKKAQQQLDIEKARAIDASKIGDEYILTRKSGEKVRVSRSGSGYIDQRGKRVIIGADEKLDPVEKAPSIVIESGTKKTIEGELLGNVDVLSRLDRLEKSYDPEFLTLGGKIELSAARRLDKLGIPISEGMRENLGKGATFLQASYENMNAIIKQITGAQMSEAEANRIRKQLPDPEKDSPQEFRVKMNNAIVATRLAVARSTIERSGAFAGSFSKSASLSDTKDLLMSVGNTEYQRLVSEGIEPTQAASRVRDMILNNFGVDIQRLRETSDAVL